MSDGNKLGTGASAHCTAVGNVPSPTERAHSWAQQLTNDRR
jgi:hypothetical protein